MAANTGEVARRSVERMRLVAEGKFAVYVNMGYSSSNDQHSDVDGEHHPKTKQAEALPENFNICGP